MKYQYLLVAAFAFALVVSWGMGYTPIMLGVVVVIFSFTAYYLYALDKSAAKTGAWRVSEIKLHSVAMLCGWPGALIAQERLRHKTKKQSFRAVFWICVLANIGGIAYLHRPQVNVRFREGMRQFEKSVIASVPYAAVAVTVRFLTKFRDG